MVKYHVNPETLKPGVCKAEYKCAFKDSNGDTVSHYNSMGEASKASEASLAKRFGSLKSFNNDNSVKTFSVADDSRFSGLVGDYPRVEDTRIQIEETGQILTVKMSYSPSRRGFPVAVDENGENVPRYVPGPAYKILDGPNTKSFKKELESIELSQRVLKNLDNYGQKVSALEERINNNTSSKKRLKLTSTLSGYSNSDIKPSFSVYGSNADGSKMFKFVLAEDGGVYFTGAESRLSKNVSEALNSVSKKEVDELFKARRERDKLAKEYSDLEEDIRENYFDVM